MAKWIIAATCASVLLIALTCFWMSGIAMNEDRWICVGLTSGGLLWLAIPIQIKDPLESLLTYQGYTEIDWPDEWSDFMAVSAMIVGMFLVFL